jgi:cytochrome P450
MVMLVITNRHGETFKTRLLGRSVAVLASPAGNKAVFAHADVAWPASAVAVAGPASLIGQAGPGAERVRAALLAFLRPDALQHYTGPIEAIVGSFIREHLPHRALHPLVTRFSVRRAWAIYSRRSVIQEY